jgi:hypothetical protein
MIEHGNCYSSRDWTGHLDKLECSTSHRNFANYQQKDPPTPIFLQHVLNNVSEMLSGAQVLVHYISKIKNIPVNAWIHD